MRLGLGAESLGSIIVSMHRPQVCLERCLCPALILLFILMLTYATHLCSSPVTSLNYIPALTCLRAKLNNTGLTNWFTLDRINLFLGKPTRTCACILASIPFYMFMSLCTYSLQLYPTYIYNTFYVLHGKQMVSQIVFFRPKQR